MERISIEVKVGLVVTFTIILVLVFLVLLGDLNPFSNTYNMHVVLNYAGSIEPGSAVQVAGAKVGRVESISFFEPGHRFNDEEVSLDVKLKIDKRAQHLIRNDSRVYINMEGFIGGKYVEVQPGSKDAPELIDGQTVRGVDPPRIEQFLSQGFDIFGRVTALLEEMGLDDQDKLMKILEDVEVIAGNLSTITTQVTEKLDPLLSDTQALLGETRNVVAEIQPLLNQASPLVTKVRGILGDLDNITSELGNIDTAKKEQVKQRLDDLLQTSEQLISIVDRLERFSAGLENELGDFDSAEIERLFRQFMQQEGITINVGTILGKPEYPLE